MFIAKLIVDVRWVATRGTKLTGNLALNQVNFLTNGLREALDITRAGGDAKLFDDMFRGSERQRLDDRIRCGRDRP